MTTWIWIEFSTEENMKAILSKTIPHSLNWDAFTPYPIHGLEKLKGHKPSPIGCIAFIGSMSAGIGSFALWTWMSVVDYPIWIGGKPLLSWPAFFIPSYECAVLFGAISTVVGFLLWSKLPCWAPSHTHPLIKKGTNDGFIATFEIQGDPNRFIQLVEGFAKHIEMVSDE